MVLTPRLINFRCFTTVCIFVAGLSTVGCTTNMEKVMHQDTPSMEEVYNDFAGGASKEDLKERKRELQMRPLNDNARYLTGFPPYQERAQHLYPKLPNQELYMYVRPHPVGESGVPIPAYITRFSMYRQTHYAMPGETVATIRNIPGEPRAPRSEEQCSQCSYSASYPLRPVPEPDLCRFPAEKQRKGKVVRSMPSYVVELPASQCRKENGEVVRSAGTI